VVISCIVACKTYLRAHLQAEKTYIMLQPTNMDSRLWLDFPSVQKAADGTALDLAPLIALFAHSICTLHVTALLYCQDHVVAIS
jgi:hypothetical protein